jgi:hypothetical protein
MNATLPITHNSRTNLEASVGWAKARSEPAIGPAKGGTRWRAVPTGTAAVGTAAVAAKGRSFARPAPLPTLRSCVNLIGMCCSAATPEL